MRVLAPVLGAIGTFLGAFVAAFLAKRRVVERRRSVVGPVIAVAVTLTLCIMTILMVIAVMD